jgi:hypothetical protein
MTPWPEPAPAPRASHLSSALFVLVGAALVLAAIAAAGVYFLSSAPKPGGITFEPSTVDCSSPPAWTATIVLPASLVSGDAISLRWDGKTYDPSTLREGGHIDGLRGSDTWLQLTDGGWAGTYTTAANWTYAACIGSEGAEWAGDRSTFSVGSHDFEILDSSGKLVASGTYTVVRPEPLLQ